MHLATLETKMFFPSFHKPLHHLTPSFFPERERKREKERERERERVGERSKLFEAESQKSIERRSFFFFSSFNQHTTWQTIR
jgi:hypothetical protein